MDDNEIVSVSIWFNGLSQSTIEKRVLKNLLQKTNTDKMIDSYVSSVLERNDLNLRDQISYNVNIQDIQKLISVERETISQIYNEYNNKIIEDMLDSKLCKKTDILYVSKYLPNLEMTLNKREIYLLSKNENINSFYLKEELECVEDNKQNSIKTSSIDANYHLNWQKITGIAKARDQYGLDGSGIKVGQIESNAVNPNLDLFSYAVQNGNLTTYSNNYYSLSPEGHANYTASILIGKSSNYTAAVPNIHLYSISSNATVWKQKIETLLLAGVNIINASTYYLGNDTLGEYGDSCKWIDSITSTMKVTVFISSGNKGENDNKLVRGAMAYNAITVGNLSDKNTEDTSDDVVDSIYLSSGAYKPDVVAPGSYVGSGYELFKTNGGY